MFFCPTHSKRSATHAPARSLSLAQLKTLITRLAPAADTLVLYRAPQQPCCTAPLLRGLPRACAAQAGHARASCRSLEAYVRDLSWRRPRSRRRRPRARQHRISPHLVAAKRPRRRCCAPPSTARRTAPSARTPPTPARARCRLVWSGSSERSRVARGGGAAAASPPSQPHNNKQKTKKHSSGPRRRRYASTSTAP